MKLIFKVHIYLFHPAERPVPESLPGIEPVGLIWLC